MTFYRLFLRWIQLVKICTVGVVIFFWGVMHILYVVYFVETKPCKLCCMWRCVVWVVLWNCILWTFAVELSLDLCLKIIDVFIIIHLLTQLPCHIYCLFQFRGLGIFSTSFQVMQQIGSNRDVYQIGLFSFQPLDVISQWFSVQFREECPKWCWTECCHVNR